MKRLLVGGSLLGAAGLFGWKTLHRSSALPAEKLRNAEGVGSTHIPGATRGEEQMSMSGSYEVSSPAGRIAGSIHPESRGPGGGHGHGARSSWGRKRWERWTGTSLPTAVVPAPAPSQGPRGDASWISSFR